MFKKKQQRKSSSVLFCETGTENLRGWNELLEDSQATRCYILKGEETWNKNKDSKTALNSG